MTDPKSTFQASGSGMRRLIIAMDLEHYSQLPDSGQREAQRAMSELLNEAGQHGALERAQWDIQPQGDGELALLPPGIDEAAVITSLMREVTSGLYKYNRRTNPHNRRADPSARLRMRIAIHEGLTYVADSGFAGDAVNTACRLRDAKEAKDALRNTDNDVVLIVSERIYRDVICGDDSYDLPPASFRETEIVMADKGFRAQAFIFAGRLAKLAPDGAPETAPGDEPEPAMEASPAEAAPAPQPATQGGSTFTFTGPTTVGDIAGRDVNKYSPARPSDGARDE
jgi:hypothetical protein